MTAQEILSGAMERAKTVPGYAGSPSPILLRRFYDEIMDEITGMIGNFYQEWSINVASGQAQYCLPDVDRIEAAYIRDASGTKKDLGHLHSGDARGLDAYRSSSVGTPQILIYEGIGRGRLWPAPDYTTAGSPANGLYVDGYGPYSPSAYTLSTSNPLKRQDQTCVEVGVAWLVLSDAGHPLATDRRSRYTRLKNQIEINAADYSPAHRMERTGFAGSITSVDALNPLNY